MVRIIAGAAGGRKLQAPPGAATRPTSDRVREALFSTLDARHAVRGMRVLDLFAGSGALGLEASSRGAAEVVLVDSSRQAAQAARRNVAAVGMPRVTVVVSAVQRYLARPPTRAFDVAFLDPPYDLAETVLAEHLAMLTGWLGGHGLVVVERSSRSPEPRWPRGLERDQVRRYGETSIWIAVRTGRAPGAQPSTGAVDR